MTPVFDSGFKSLGCDGCGVREDYSTAKRDPDFQRAEVHYATPGGARSVSGMVTTDKLEQRPVAVVVERDDTTYTVPFDRVFQIVSVD